MTRYPLSGRSEGLASLRRGAGLSQSQMAAAVGVSVSAVRNWESGRGHPSEPAARLLAQVLKVTRDELEEALGAWVTVKRITIDEARERYGVDPDSPPTLGDNSEGGAGG